MRLRATAAGMLAVLLLAGCSERAQEASPAPVRTEASAAPSAAVTPSAMPSADPTYRVGDQAAPQIASGPLKVKVYAYKQPTAKSAPRPQADGFEWGSADVEVCVPEAGTVSRVVWHLSFADNTTVDPSNIGYNQFPQPEYPWDERPVRAGQCVRGWITFGVPKGVKPATVVYRPEGTTVEWTVI